MTNEHVLAQSKINRKLTDYIRNVYFQKHAFKWNEQNFKQTHDEGKTL